MNHNNKMGLFAYAWRVYKGLCIALFIALLVMVATIFGAWPNDGYERDTTLLICGLLFVVVFGVSAFKIWQSYRDYLNGRSR